MNRVIGQGSDWALDAVYGSYSYGSPWYGLYYVSYPKPTRFKLSIYLTTAEADELAADSERRFWDMSFSGDARSGQMYVSDINVTAQEADRMVNGEHPRNVLFWSMWPDGYRLRVVPEVLTT